MADSAALAPQHPEKAQSVPLGELIGQYGPILEALPAKGDIPAATLYPLLLLRDQIAKECAAKSPPLTVLEAVRDLDKSFKDALGRICLKDMEAFEAWRDTVQAPAQNWWWHQERTPSVWWTIAAVLFLTLSVTLMTDLSRRILGNDPDELGMLSIALQAVAAVAATSTFTDAGRAWVESVLSHFHVPRQFQARWNVILTSVLLCGMIWAWFRVPGHLAWVSNSWGVHASSPAAEIRYLQRAVALSPDFAVAHYNLGSTYEKSYEYDKATAEYQQTLELNPWDVSAYANLSRLLVIGGQAYTALRATDDGLKIVGRVESKSLRPQDLDTIAGLYRDRAWAEFQLGFYSDAEADAKQAATDTRAHVSAECLLGKIYTQEKKTTEAQQAWKDFKDTIASGATLPVIEPDCSRLAEEASNGAK